MNIKVEGEPLCVLIAYEFSKKLMEEIDLEKLLMVNHLNHLEANEGICHSHDYCDSNMVMADAFEQFDIDAGNTDLWNETWSIAKRHDFFVETLG